MHNQRPDIFLKNSGRYFFALILFFCHAVFSQDAESSDSFFIKAETNIRFGVRPTFDEPLAFPVLGLASLNTGLQPGENLYFALSAFAAIPVQAGLPHVDAFADLGDSYLKYTHPEFVLTLGQIRVPWQTLQASALNDRLNPIDYRRGIDFSQDINGRVPQWGFQVKGTLLGFSTEGVYFFWHRPNPSSLAFVEQDGVQVGHYQGGFAKTREELSALFPAGLQREAQPWFTSPTVAIKAQRHVGLFDLGFNVVWGFDEVPTIIPTGTLGAGRTLSFGGQSSVTLGVAILKAEAVVSPRINNDVGKVTILRSPNSLVSQPLTNLVLGVGIDAEYGDEVSGSLELIDTMWFGVPPGFHVHTIEAIGTETTTDRFVQRLALTFGLNGNLFSESLAWKLRGEMGLNRPDILATLDLQHEFPETGFTIGTFANLFFGVPQSPGWFRSPATEIGVKVGYHL